MLNIICISIFGTVFAYYCSSVYRVSVSSGSGSLSPVPLWAALSLQLLFSVSRAKTTETETGKERAQGTQRIDAERQTTGSLSLTLAHRRTAEAAVTGTGDEAKKREIRCCCRGLEGTPTVSGDFSAAPVTSAFSSCLALRKTSCVARLVAL